MSEDTNKASQSEEEKVEERKEDPSEIYAELDRAAEEVEEVKEEVEAKKEEEKTEETETEVKAEAEETDENVSRETIEPDNNAERSKLGRKVKNIEDTLAQILAKLETKPEDVREDVKKEITPEIDLDEDFLIPTTKKEFLEQVASIIENPEIAAKVIGLQRKEKDAELQKQIDYEKKYVSSIADFKEDPYYDEVSQILLNFEDKNNPFNRQHDINTPMVDAEKNFLAAKAHVLETKLKGTDKQINLRQDKRQPSKPDIETKNTTHVKKEMQLDPHAASFVKHLKNRGENTEELIERAFAQ